jgi:acetyl-CoA C-acetyltransferase
MTDAFVYDAVRTPRGKGKADGSLHEVTALALATQALGAIKDRNKLRPGVVDDVVLGCVDPVGEAGGDIARAAALTAGYGNTVAGVQINRFCASGPRSDQLRLRAGDVRPARHDHRRRRRVDEPRRHGASGGAWPMDPAIAVPTYFLPQGISADLIATKYGFSRDDVDAYAVESQKRSEGLVGRGNFNIPSIAGEGRQRHHHPRQGRAHASDHRRCSRSVSCSRPSCRWGRCTASTRSRCRRIRTSSMSQHVHHAGNSSGIVDGAAAVLIGNKESGAKLGRKPRARIRAFANIGSETRDHAHRSARRDAEGPAQGRNATLRHRPVRAERGIRRRSCCATCRR